MIKKIISVLLLSVFLVLSFSNNTYANTNQELTIESYKKYLKENNLKDIEIQFNKLSIFEKNKLIEILNSWEIKEEYTKKEIVRKNNFEFRIPWETKFWRYTEEIDLIFKPLWIPVSNIKVYIDYNYSWKKITRINEWTKIKVDYNYNPVNVIEIDYKSEVIKESKHWYYWDWFHLIWDIKYRFWLIKWLFQVWSDRDEFWRSADWKIKIDNIE